MSGRSPDHDVFEKTPLVGGTPKTHLVLLVLLRCRIGLTPQSDVTQLLSSVSELSWDKMCFWYTAITMSVPKTIRQGCAPTPCQSDSALSFDGERRYFLDSVFHSKAMREPSSSPSGISSPITISASVS